MKVKRAPSTISPTIRQDQEFLKGFDKNSTNFIIRSGKDIDADETSEVPGDEEGWKKLLKPKRRAKPTTTAYQTQSSSNDTANENPQKKQHAESSADNVIKIHNHSVKSGKPTECGIYLQPVSHAQLGSSKLKLNTLIFANKKSALSFMEKIPTSLFGDKASYELYKPKRSGQAPRDTTQDWNAVIRVVDPEININEFETEMKEHGIQFRKTKRIVTPYGDKTGGKNRVQNRPYLMVSQY